LPGRCGGEEIVSASFISLSLHLFPAIENGIVRILNGLKNDVERLWRVTLSTGFARVRCYS